MGFNSEFKGLNMNRGPGFYFNHW